MMCKIAEKNVTHRVICLQQVVGGVDSNRLWRYWSMVPQPHRQEKSWSTSTMTSHKRKKLRYSCSYIRE